MNSPHRHTESDFQLVVGKLAPMLRFQIPDSEIEAAFAELSLPSPSKAVCSHVRKLLAAELEKRMQTLCTEFSVKFEAEPKPRDFNAALDATGYIYSRRFRDTLLKMLRSQNAQRWAPAADLTRRVVRLADGEVALWEALHRTYDLKPEALASMLLRLFAVVTSTGKVDPLEVPYLTSPVTDKDLKRYAQSLNFTVKPTNKSRA